MQNSLDPRAAELLKLLIERYISDGQPVASRTLSRAVGMRLSPATIRNVMADLDDLGFVCSPHTSAGRIPTTRGYRYFVDTLLEPEPLSANSRNRIARELLSGDTPPGALVQAASALLSSLSTMAGVVTVPRRNRAILRRIEFLPLSDKRVLAILVVNQREVQNRIVQVERDYAPDELERLANAINAQYAGQDLLTLSEALRADIGAAKSQVDETLRAAVALVQSATEPVADDDLVVAGGANLFAFEELANLDRLRGLFDALDRKRELLSVFEQCVSADGVQLFIGDESGYRVLDECSVVTAPYYVDGQVAGVLGVIGPTRMAYSRIIPLVSNTARLLSRGLKVG
jgi:heat-inducible transcriptional repressor